MRSELETARAAVDDVERRMSAFARPMATLAELCRPETQRAYQVRLQAWRDANPALEAQWRGLCAEAQAAERRMRELEARAAEEARSWSRLQALELGERTIEGLRLGGATPALEAVRRWLDARPRPWALVLLGGAGVGKTVAAALAAQRALAAGRSVQWVRVAAASRESTFGDEAAARERRWRTAGLLVLDDLGAEFASEAWTAVLDSVLDARWSNNAPTVLTSNVAVPDLRARLGVRVADRLAQEGRVEACGDVSLRRKAVVP